MKKFISFIGAIAAAASVSTAYADAVSDTAQYVYNNVKEPTFGVIGGEWAILGLARSNANVPESYFSDYYNRIEQYTVNNNGILDARKNTEYARVVMALTAIGRDPQNVGGYNLLMPFADYRSTVAQGLNGAVFALLALDCGKYEIPLDADAEVQATREMYIDTILLNSTDNGAFELFADGGEDIDITAMALTALSSYMYDDEVCEVVNQSLEYLSTVQQSDGGFSNEGVENAESSAQVLTALSALGISERDEHFVKNGNSVKDSLMKYAVDGGFAHNYGGKADQMTTEQALYALTAAKRNSEGKTKLFDMSDVKKVNINKDKTEKNVDVNVNDVMYDDISFTDVEDGKSEIEALAARGIVNGKSEDKFAPYDSMTRAELATIIVRGLGLPFKMDRTFEDVNDDDWFKTYVYTAAAYSIVNGISENEFNPYGTVTREQAMAMIVRAANLCGLNTDMDDTHIRNVLAQFGDYITVSAWAKDAAAYCYSTDILSQSDLNIEPSRNIMRFEVAKMLYNMLEKASLL